MTIRKEDREAIVEEYKLEDPTPETSTEIVKAIAEGRGVSPNAVRFLLMEEKVYVKKDATAKDDTAKTTTSKRVSKEDAINVLRETINGLGKEVDEDIITKLTGKAAIYITSLLK